ncbi:MAG: hypothetical protein HFK09_01915 [Clostridia bacterium]|nr:hypothetical protein [Clostridia bacterium]
MRKHRLFIALAVFLMLSVFCCAFVACGNGNVVVPPTTTPSDNDPDVPTKPPVSEPEIPPTTEPVVPPVDPTPPDPPITEPEIPPVSEPEIPPTVDPPPEEPKEEDPIPSQKTLLESLDKTLWTDGFTLYRFNSDGGIDTLSINPNGAISFISAGFKWEYKDDLLYFVSSEISELVEIAVEPKEIIKSSLLSESISRSDGVLINGYFISERNLYTRAFILFENGKAAIGNDYSAFSDELAETPVTAETETVYIYPSDIHKVVISFNDGEFDNITLHNYLGDNYIRSHELTLPQIQDENFIGWRYGDITYDSVCNILFDLSDNENIELIATYKQIEEPAPPEIIDQIVGTYEYKTKAGEITHTVIFDKNNNMIIYEVGKEEPIGSYKWSKSISDKNVYLVENNLGTLLFSNEGINVNCREIKKLILGKTIGSCILTAKTREAE